METPLLRPDGRRLPIRWKDAATSYLTGICLLHVGSSNLLVGNLTSRERRWGYPFTRLAYCAPSLR